MPSGTVGRRAYIDWARGIAVLLMIEAHTIDAWTRPAARHSGAFRRAIVLGGFAAPLFLWLAGVAVALSAAHLMRRCHGRRAVVETICQRGLEIFVLAFLFRLQAFLVSPGSYLVTVFRVDILNIMGPAIVAAGLIRMLSDRSATLAVCYAVAAAAIALITPVVRTTALVNALPLWLQWYARPSGDLTTFTIFPWVGFVFAGAACGVLLAAVNDTRGERRMHLAFAAAGLALVVLGVYTSTRPSIYQRSEFWSSSPTWFAIRVGVLMTCLSMAYAIESIAARWKVTCRPLERFGRSSLFVYWIHVELVYGYVSWAWRGRLPIWGAFGAFALFSLLMYGAVIFRDRLVEWWRMASRARTAKGATTPLGWLWSSNLVSRMSESRD